MKKYFVTAILFLSLSAIGFSQDAFQYAGININNGSKYSNSRSVSLDLQGAKAIQMMLSNTKGFENQRWEVYKEKVQNWQLPSGDGEKIVYVKYKDKDGNESDVFQDDILVDTTPPENPYVKINCPNGITNSKSLIFDLTLSAVDAKYMMVSNVNTFYGGKWRVFQDVLSDWEFEAGDDGPRSVFVQFRDQAGNVSAVATDQIIVDRQPPFGGEIKVNDGAEYVTEASKELKIAIFAKGADSVAIAHGSSFTPPIEWMPFASSAIIKAAAEGEDGKKTISVKFKDIAGNESEVFSTQYLLDTTPPTNCSIQINGGAATTDQYDKVVKLTLSAEGAAFMQISNFPSFKNARWEKFRSEVPDWKLEGEDNGNKIVYVRFKDAAENVSQPAQATIKLERDF